MSASATDTQEKKKRVLLICLNKYKYRSGYFRSRNPAPGTVHQTKLQGIEKCQTDDEKNRKGSVKYLGDLAEETETRIPRPRSEIAGWLIKELAK